MPARRARKPREPAPKSEATRRKLLDRALKLFQQRGVEGTTMRDVARAAGLSLGAAYYYFPSKEALVFAYYQANQDEAEAASEAASGSVRERLGAVFHRRLETMRPYRKMLAALVGRVVDPRDPLSALSAQQRDVRERAVALFERALDGTGLPPDVVRLAAHALWMFQLAGMLVFVHDESPRQARTHQLIDDALDLVVPVLPLLATPLGRGFVDRVTAALDRAGISVA